MKLSYKRGTYKKVDRVCEVCDITFQGTKKAKFCSNKCKQKNKNNRVTNSNTKQEKSENPTK